MKIFARNFRGFKQIEVDTSKITFLVGDNSSGKSSIIHLINSVVNCDLNRPPRLNEEIGVGAYDYFSPFFSNAPVTFGFSFDYRDETIVKVITVSKTEEIPRLTKCSYWFRDKFVSLKTNRDNLMVSVQSCNFEKSAKNALKLHSSRNKFSVAHRKFSGSVAEVHALLLAIDIKDVKNESIKPMINTILNMDIPTAQLLSPIRAMPERFYSFRRRIESKGSHFATMWLDIKRQDSQISEIINEFGREAKLFDALDVKELSSDVDKPPLLVTIKKNGNTFLMDQVGIGVSQVVPILIESIFAHNFREEPILVMQPELHLHPVAQAAFGSFLFSMAQAGLRGVFETHSSFLLDRFRSDMREKARSECAGLAEIVFCSNDESGNRAKHIQIHQDGSISGEPTSYHQFFVDELVRTMF